MNPLYRHILVPVLAMAALNSCDKHMPEEDKIPEYTQEDIAFDELLQKYPDTDYSSAVSEVDVQGNTISIRYSNLESGSTVLAEIPPYMDYLQITEPLSATPVEKGQGTVTVDRYIEADGIRYDRLLSKWGLMKKDAGAFTPVSHARYADHIQAVRSIAPCPPLKNKKGIGGIINTGFLTDLEELDACSATINLLTTSFTWLSESKGRIAHEYGGKTYWFDENFLKLNIDNVLLRAAERDMAVAGIVLVSLPSSCADPQLSAVINHPDCNGGTLTYPDITDPEGVNCFAAIMDFLIERYSRPDGKYGRIAHWIVMNEVDAASQWTNIGNKPMHYMADYYIKLLRLTENILRQYDASAEVFASFTHSWTLPAGSFSGKEMLEYIVDAVKAEGDFKWALAQHCYPGDLFNPRSWDCPYTTFSMQTQCVTFGNLEVLDKWIKMPEHMYNGTEKRTVWLSEAGLNTRSYSEQDLAEQAAGYAYAWKKINALDGIDAHQWHNWFDNPAELVYLGIRKVPDPTYQGEKKPVWYLMQAAGTEKEDELFAPYLDIIGIENWDIIVDEDQIQ